MYSSGTVISTFIIGSRITTPDCLHPSLNAIGDVNSRRGRMEGMDGSDGMQEIHSFIPLSEMFGYATDLRSKTQGRGTYSMEPSHYEEVPKSVLEQIVASRGKKSE